MCHCFRIAPKSRTGWFINAVCESRVNTSLLNTCENGEVLDIPLVWELKQHTVYPTTHIAQTTSGLKTAGLLRLRAPFSIFSRKGHRALFVLHINHLSRRHKWFSAALWKIVDTCKMQLISRKVKQPSCIRARIPLDRHQAHSDCERVNSNNRVNACVVNFSQRELSAQFQCILNESAIVISRTNISTTIVPPQFALDGEKLLPTPQLVIEEKRSTHASATSKG
jgi:hypothetical protein